MTEINPKIIWYEPLIMINSFKDLIPKKMVIIKMKMVDDIFVTKLFMQTKKFCLFNCLISFSLFYFIL